MPYFNPPGLSPIALEFDPDGVWALACSLVRECLSKAGLSGADIAAVSTTGQRGGMALLDRNGKELYAGPNRDVRAFFEGMAIDEGLGEQVYKLTGHMPSFLFAPARLAWFRANAPETAGKIAHLLPLGDWLGLRLSGEIRGERSAVTELGLLPVSDSEPRDAVSTLLGIDSSLMPHASFAGEQTGEVNAATAAETGLSTGAPVIAGGPDTQCGLLGMGVTEAGELGILVGWSGPLQMVTSSPCIDLEGRTWTGRHILEDRWVLESTTTEAGRSLDWACETLGFPKHGMAFNPREPASSETYTPFAFMGPRIMDAKRLGIQMGGMLFPTPVGHTDISRRGLANAALKNLAFAIRGNAIQLEEISGRRPVDIALGGGVTGIGGFPQLVADTLAREITVPWERDATLLGSAVCAAVGSGAYNSLPEAARAMMDEGETLSPDGARAEDLEEECEEWLDLYERLAEITGRM